MYTRNTNGITIVQNKISENFINELKSIVLEFNDFMEIKNNNINYINLYQKNLNLKKHDYLLDYIKEIDMIKESLETCSILYYGFIISQPRNKNQYFHIDYKGKTITYFIPLVCITDKNGTEYLYFYDSSNYKKYFNVFLEITKKFITRDEIIFYLEKYDLIHKKDYEFRFANCDAYSVIMLPHDVFHRGKTNETNEYRIMFQITLELESIDFIQNEQFVPIAEDDDNMK
jgi:hypothetical protein